MRLKILLACALITIGLVLNLACSNNKAPILVGQSGLGIAQGIGQLQTTTKQLTDAKVLTPEQALKVQQALLDANGKMAPLPQILLDIDAAQTAGNPTATLVERGLAVLQVVANDMNIVVGGVPVSDATKQVLALITSTQTTIATVTAQLNKLKGQ
jgi:alcohol dehydrogenase class IV